MCPGDVTLPRGSARHRDLIDVRGLLDDGDLDGLADSGDVVGEGRVKSLSATLASVHRSVGTLVDCSTNVDHRHSECRPETDSMSSVQMTKSNEDAVIPALNAGEIATADVIAGKLASFSSSSAANGSRSVIFL